MYMHTLKKKKKNCLTGHLHNVSGDDFSGLDHLHTLPVRTVNFAHLRLVLLKSLDGIFSVTLLWQNKKERCWNCQ